MKQIIMGIFLLSYLVIHPSLTNAINMPCSIVLEPIDKTLTNAKGTALIYNVQLHPPSFPRTNLSILAVHLPAPSTYGNYNSYEGFAYIPEEISWRFRLYPTPEEESPTWAGRFDLITAKMENVHVQVKLSNSKTNKLGPSILTNHIQSCK